LVHFYLLFDYVDALDYSIFVYKVGCAVGTVDFFAFCYFSVAFSAGFKLGAAITIS